MVRVRTGFLCLACHWLTYGYCTPSLRVSLYTHEHTYMTHIRYTLTDGAQLGQNDACRHCDEHL